MLHSRDETLALLRGESVPRLPVYSGLPSVTEAGLQAVGVRYAESHTDAGKMALAAASTFRLFGFESAVVPLDMCVEAEALGAGVDFHTDVDLFLPPVVTTSLRVDNLSPTGDIEHAGRVPLVAQAIRELKADMGREIAIGAWVPGPFTLAWQLFGGDAWLEAIQSDRAGAALDRLVACLRLVIRSYRQAGADFITVHEMGGSPQAVGLPIFQRHVIPALGQLFAQIESPKVLSMCGDTNAVVRELAQCGADALNVDHRNELAATRRLLGPEAVLLGNYDPVAVLSLGTPELVAQTVHRIRLAGANAIWPGCDLAPEVPAENMRALMNAARQVREL